MTQCILVVDDDGDVRELMCRMLEQDGYRVVPANGGEHALEQMERLDPDLVITDVVMPGVDGFEVLLKLRILAPRAQALVVSGGGRVGPDIYLETAKRLGARAVLRKPFTRAEMLEAVRQALGPRTSPQPSRQEP
jgi:CheY-like chemotaxis protein